MDKLPVELWGIIFERLPHTDVARLASVASIWRRRLNSDQVWRPRTEKIFARELSRMPKPESGKWKETFADLYLREIRMRDGPRGYDSEPFPLRFLVFAGLSVLFIVAVILLVFEVSLAAILSFFIAIIDSVWFRVGIYVASRVRQLLPLGTFPRAGVFEVLRWLGTASVIFSLVQVLRYGFSPDLCIASMRFATAITCITSSLYQLLAPVTRPHWRYEAQLLILLCEWYAFNNRSATLLVLNAFAVHRILELIKEYRLYNNLRMMHALFLPLLAVLTAFGGWKGDVHLDVLFLYFIWI